MTWLIYVDILLFYYDEFDYKIVLFWFSTYYLIYSLILSDISYQFNLNTKFEKSPIKRIKQIKSAYQSPSIPIFIYTENVYARGRQTKK